MGVATRGLCAIAQAESLRYKLIGGLAVRRACYGVLRFIMESGAKGCEVVVSGKLRGQRAKSMKFTDGLMIHSGEPRRHYVDDAVRHVHLRQGVLGIKVKIMLPWDPTGKNGPRVPLPDHISIVEPKEETLPSPPLPLLPLALSEATPPSVDTTTARGRLRLMPSLSSLELATLVLLEPPSLPLPSPPLLMLLPPLLPPLPTLPPLPSSSLPLASTPPTSPFPATPEPFLPPLPSPPLPLPPLPLPPLV